MVLRNEYNFADSFRLPMPEIVEDPRYEGLDEADRSKVGNNVNIISSNKA